MSNTATAAAPTANSSPNTKSPLPGKDEKAWSKEIHTGPEYNGALPVADIVPDPENRKEYDAAALHELSASIKELGLQQPIVVRPVPQHPYARAGKKTVISPDWLVFRDDDSVEILYRTTVEADAQRVAAIYRSGHGWQIIAGERRWRAHMLGKIPTIAARIDRGAVDVDAVEKQIVENLQREDLNPIEEARQMKRLSDLGRSQKEIGKRFGGKSQPVVAQTLALLKLPAAVQALIAKYELSPAQGAELVRFSAWPRACECMARHAMHGSYEGSAKGLRDKALPFASSLCDAKFAVSIYTGDYSYAGRQKYKMPEALAKSHGFFKSYDSYYYLLPEDGSPNLWEPEQKKQDLAREALAKLQEKKAATAKKDSKPTKEQKERADKLVKNKAARETLARSLQTAEERLNLVKDYDPPSVRVVVAAVLGDYQVQKQLEAAAKAIGVTLPKGFDETDLEHLAKIDPVDLLLVAATAVARMHAHYAHRDASEVPEQVAHLMTKSGKK